MKRSRISSLETMPFRSLIQPPSSSLLAGRRIWLGRQKRARPPLIEGALHHRIGFVVASGRRGGGIPPSHVAGMRFH